MSATPRESVKLSARVPGEHYHAMLAAVQSLDSPFSTTTDIVRHFIERGLAELAEEIHDEEYQAAVHAVRTRRDLQQLERFDQAGKDQRALSAKWQEAKHSSDEKWAGDVREACLRFAKETPFRSLAERMRRDL